MILAYLATPKFGGWVSYTCHLAEALQAATGKLPRIVRTGKTTAAKPQHMLAPLQYLRVAETRLEPVASKVLITAVDAQHVSLAIRLVEAGAGLVLHDPTELSPLVLEAARKARVLIVVREAMLHLLEKEHGIIATGVRHPYTPEWNWSQPDPEPTFPAVSISRLDWDKHLEAIVQLNANGGRVAIYGAENRMYTHHKLTPLDKNWRTHYRGKLPAYHRAGAAVARNAGCVVDLSAIKHDGGGTQYTFMEAWDAGATLIISNRWLVDGGEMQPGVNCVAVDPDDTQALQVAIASGRNPELTANGRRLLRTSHEPATIGGIVADLMA
jgi:hypothetical protein